MIELLVRSGVRSYVVLRSTDRWELRRCAHWTPARVEKNCIVYSATPENVRAVEKTALMFGARVAEPEKWEELLARTEEAEERAAAFESLQERPEPPGFRGKLRPFQKVGLDFLCKGGVLLADEMGLGKTVQAIAYLCQERAWPAVVVSPLVTLVNWRREFEKFAPGSSHLVRGGKRAPVPAMNGLFGESRVVIINYELLHKRVDDIIAAGPQAVVFDEVQALRNKGTDRYYAARKLADACPRRVALSGTPVYNRPYDVHSIVDVVAPGMLGTAKEFEATHGESSDPRCAGLAERLKQRVMLRRLKTQVARDLPSKTREQRTIQVGADYARAIEGLASRLGPALVGGPGPAFDLAVIQARTTERQAAGLAKAPFAADYLKTMLDDTGEPVVAFCHHRNVHALLVAALADYSPVSIAGGQSDKDRQKAIDDFQSGKAKAAVCSLRAGNVGISLTAASRVVFAELDWSPAVHRQAEDRLHRVGQKSPVWAYYLAGAGTFDEELIGALVSKSEQADAILGDPHAALVRLITGGA